MKDAEITNMFKMEKKAHLRKLKEALKVLQHPNKGVFSLFTSPFFVSLKLVVSSFF